MKTTRRMFLKRGALLGSGAVLLHSGVSRLGAAEANTSEANPTLNTLHSLRTIHGNFTDQPVSDEAIRAIIDASVRAANASNNQSYSIIVLKDRKMMRSVCGYQGGCTLVYCADHSRMKALAAALGHTYEPRTVAEFLNATINTVLAAQTAVVAAKSLGIDSLITNGLHRGDIERHWELLGLPQKHCFPVLAIVLGYPTEEPPYRMGRLTGPGVVHHDRYQPLTREDAAQAVWTYDDKQRHLALNDDWAGRGYKHYLDWYFNEWVGRGGPVPSETPMLRRLKRSGFIESPAT
jgi:nitroreductase